MPEEITKSIIDTLTRSLVISHTGPQGIMSATRQSIQQWIQQHYVTTTNFDNTSPRRSFEMTIRPKYKEKHVPQNIELVMVLVLGETRPKFSIKFEVNRGKKLGE